VSTTAAGTADTVDQTCSARGAHGRVALSTSSKQADEDTLYAAWTVAAITV
jgi:hypothetical protein